MRGLIATTTAHDSGFQTSTLEVDGFKVSPPAPPAPFVSLPKIVQIASFLRRRYMVVRRGDRRRRAFRDFLYRPLRHARFSLSVSLWARSLAKEQPGV